MFIKCIFVIFLYSAHRTDLNKFIVMTIVMTIVVMIIMIIIIVVAVL